MPKKSPQTLEQLGIPTVTFYRIEIFYETDDENDTEVEIRRHVTSLKIDNDKADYNMMPGSPASSPYVTVEGTSRRHVEQLAIEIVKLLQEQDGVSLQK